MKKFLLLSLTLLLSSSIITAGELVKLNKEPFKDIPEVMNVLPDHIQGTLFHPQIGIIRGIQIVESELSGNADSLKLWRDFNYNITTTHHAEIITKFPDVAESINKAVTEYKASVAFYLGKVIADKKAGNKDSSTNLNQLTKTLFAGAVSPYVSAMEDLATEYNEANIKKFLTVHEFNAKRAQALQKAIATLHMAEAFVTVIKNKIYEFPIARDHDEESDADFKPTNNNGFFESF